MLLHARSSGVISRRMARPFSFSVTRAGATLAEVEAERRVRDGVTEAREQFAVVRDDVAVVHRHHPRLVAREHVAAAGP